MNSYFIQCILKHYNYFDAQIAQDLAIERSFQCLFDMSPSLLERLLTFLYRKILYTQLVFPNPSHGISHLFKDPWFLLEDTFT